MNHEKVQRTVTFNVLELSDFELQVLRNICTYTLEHGHYQSVAKALLDATAAVT
jgi:hypothetical protein